MLCKRAYLSALHTHVMERGSPKLQAPSLVIVALFYCPRKCCLGLELESEQLQVLAQWFPRNSSLGNHVRRPCRREPLQSFRPVLEDRGPHAHQAAEPLGKHARWDLWGLPRGGTTVLYPEGE